MTLLDNFAPNLDTGGLPSHEFTTLIAIANNGTFGGAAAARTRIISEFNLQASDEAQLDAIIASILAAVGTEEKYKIIRDLEDSLIGYQSGHISEAEAIANLGL